MKLLVDGSHLAHRCRHSAVKELATSEGKPSGVIYGCIRGIAYTASQLGVGPEDVIVFWDHGKATWRKEILPEYKANRLKEMTPEEKADLLSFYAQIDVLRKDLPVFGIQQVDIPGCEADDLIALAAYLLYNVSGIHSVVVSGDKDFHQLLQEKFINIWDHKHLRLLSRDEVLSQWNIYDWAELLPARAMIGDPSDNIQGVKGVGPKRAAAVYRTMLSGQTDTSLAKCLEAAKSSLPVILRNIELMSLPRTWEESKYSDEAHLEFLKQLGSQVKRDERAIVLFCREWEFGSLLEGTRW